MKVITKCKVCVHFDQTIITRASVFFLVVFADGSVSCGDDGSGAIFFSRKKRVLTCPEDLGWLKV